MDCGFRFFYVVVGYYYRKYRFFFNGVKFRGKFVVYVYGYCFLCVDRGGDVVR